MDNHTRKLLGLTDKHLFFDEEWLILWADLFCENGLS